jgi:class 3 adenylate cyclase/predicted ATPase
MSAISAWLESIGLGHYAPTFVENAIEVELLPDLRDADFDRLGVKLGHRKRILNAIATLHSWPARGASAPALGTLDLDSERRHVTLLFCDLVGSTALAVELDPEDLSSVIRRFQAACTSVISRSGGHIARFIGDGLLAYFGYPHADEDDAATAVRTGLDLVAKVGQLLLPSGAPLKVRVGIATGMVVVCRGSGDDLELVGETPNLAARLQGLGFENTVVIAENTLRLLGAEFVYEPFGQYELKGFSEPVAAFKITGERAVESRFEAKHPARLTPFVGRDYELNRLRALWDYTKQGSGQVALLCGDPGIGKSRIAIALFDQVTSDPHLTLRLQCSPHHINSPLYPVIRHLQHEALFVQEDRIAAKIEKLEAMLSLAGQAVLADAPLYAALLSIPANGRYPELKLTPQRQRDLTCAALVRRLAGLARQQPVLLVVEDAHWIDPTTLEVINNIVELARTTRLFCLITFRSDFFPPWLDRSHVSMLRLDRLGRDHVGAMIFDLAGGKELPVVVLEQIISKTDGVPLFVEELTKSVLESGLIKDQDGQLVVEGTTLPLAIPATLHDSLMARLDRLAPVKEIAQIGAALGREFSYRLLAAVSQLPGTSLQSALTQLASAELIFGHGQPPESTYTFKHALVLDAAYSSLLRGKRQQLHKTIAVVLKAQFPEVVGTQPELIAHHLAQAGHASEAIEYLRKAGQRGIEGSAYREAIGHLKKALDLLHSVPENNQPTMALQLEVMLAQAMIAGLGYSATETKDTFLRAKNLLNDYTDPAQRFAVLYGLWACYYVGGDVGMQQTIASDFLAEAERHGDTGPLCLSHRTLGTTYVNMGDFSTGRRHLERARELYDPNRHSALRFQFGQDIGASALCYLSWALWQLGFVDQASHIADEAVRHAEARSHPHTLVYTICHARGMLDIMRQHPEDTPAYAAHVVSLCAEHGFPFWEAGGRILDGWAATRLAASAKGVEILRAGLNAWRRTGAKLWLPIFLAIEAQAHARIGQGDAALHAVNEAITISEQTGERWALAEVMRIKAMLLLEFDRIDSKELEALLLDALQVARRQQARCWQLRVACDLARLWHQEGRSEAALQLVQSIYDQFEEGFASHDLIDAKSLIDRLGRPLPPI